MAISFNLEFEACVAGDSSVGVTSFRLFSSIYILEYIYSNLVAHGVQSRDLKTDYFLSFADLALNAFY